MMEEVEKLVLSMKQTNPEEIYQAFLQTDSPSHRIVLKSLYDLVLQVRQLEVISVSSAKHLK